MKLTQSPLQFFKKLVQYFDNDKINKISDYSDYRFNKHIEFIKRRSFIKILLNDYEFKFREIQ